MGRVVAGVAAVVVVERLMAMVAIVCSGIAAIAELVEVVVAVAGRDAECYSQGSWVVLLEDSADVGTEEVGIVAPRIVADPKRQAEMVRQLHQS